MGFEVTFSESAAEDLEELFDFALQRELDTPARALQAIKDSVAFLAFSPFACRKSSKNPFLRELIIPFGRTGYVALFEIEDGENVLICAVRHQREDDYH